MNEESRVCPACRTPAKADAVFCSKCGSALDTQAVMLRDIEALKDRLYQVESVLGSSWVFHTSFMKRAIAIWAHTISIGLVIAFAVGAFVTIAHIH